MNIPFSLSRRSCLFKGSSVYMVYTKPSQERNCRVMTENEGSMATLNSRQYINIQCTTYKQIQYTIEQMESSALSSVPMTV